MADQAAQDQLLGQFIDIAHCSEDKAHFFLSSHKWDLEAALASFVEMSDEADVVDTTAPSGPLQPSSNQAPSSSSSQPSRSRNVATFRDLAGLADEDSDEDKEQSFYAGGEKSGIMMKGGAKKPPATDLVQNILEMAAKAGPPPNEESDDEEITIPAKPQAFTGAGYRLGSEEQPVEASTGTPSGPASVPSAPLDQQSRPETAVRHLTFWRNGFTIEDGPLLSYDDPQNQEFLQAIKTGRAPTKMLNVQFGQAVEVKVAQKLDEDYKAPPTVVKPFQGAGHKLGGVTPSGSNDAASAAKPAAGNASWKLELDNSKPVTTLQIRLADGTKLVAKFNHTHTVGDIRSFVAASTPGGFSRAFELATTFPNKVLSDDTATIADAGLLNAVVVQRV